MKTTHDIHLHPGMDNEIHIRFKGAEELGPLVLQIRWSHLGGSNYIQVRPDSQGTSPYNVFGRIVLEKPTGDGLDVTA